MTWHCCEMYGTVTESHTPAALVVKMPFREDEVIYASDLQNQHSLLNGKTASMLLFKERGVWEEVEKSEVGPPKNGCVAMAERVITTEMRARTRARETKPSNM